jgi:hypothetical protein
MATTTPNYGWDVPTSTDYVAQGAVAIETLGDDIDATLWTALGGNYPGLRLVKKQTIGNGVTSVAITDAFSATYDAYKIVVTGGAGSQEVALSAQLGNSGTFSTSSYGTFLWGVTFASTTVVSTSGTATGFDNSGYMTTGWIDASYDVINPFLAKETILKNGSWNFGSGTGFFTGRHRVATSYKDFRITTLAGTMTGGTVYIYGHGMS